MDKPSVSPQRVTQLLADWSHGDDAALGELTPLIYEELRRLAHHQMAGQRPDHTLQTTALVRDPQSIVSRLVQFLGAEQLPNETVMAAVVDSSLHRQKR